MAFSIGRGRARAARPAPLQWCSRFTVLLARDEDRVQLVRYMRDLRAIIHRSLGAMMRDNGLDETAAAHADAAPAAIAQPISSQDVPALVVIGAAAAAVWRSVRETLQAVRTAIVAFCVAGHRAQGGFQVRVREVRRHAASGPGGSPRNGTVRIPGPSGRRASRSVWRGRPPTSASNWRR